MHRPIVAAFSVSHLFTDLYRTRKWAAKVKNQQDFQLGFPDGLKLGLFCKLILHGEHGTHPTYGRHVPKVLKKCTETKPIVQKKLNSDLIQS